VAFTYGERTLYQKTELHLSQSDSSELSGITHAQQPLPSANKLIHLCHCQHPKPACCQTCNCSQRLAGVYKKVCAVIMNEALAITEMNQLVGRRWCSLSVGNTAEIQ
jgi:hypothetical protein